METPNPSILEFGSQPRIRTSIATFRVLRPAVRRAENRRCHCLFRKRHHETSGNRTLSSPLPGACYPLHYMLTTYVCAYSTPLTIQSGNRRDNTLVICFQPQPELPNFIHVDVNRDFSSREKLDEELGVEPR